MLNDPCFLACFSHFLALAGTTSFRCGPKATSAARKEAVLWDCVTSRANEGSQTGWLHDAGFVRRGRRPDAC